MLRPHQLTYSCGKPHKRNACSPNINDLVLPVDRFRIWYEKLQDFHRAYLSSYHNNKQICVRPTAVTRIRE